MVASAAPPAPRAACACMGRVACCFLAATPAALLPGRTMSGQDKGTRQRWTAEEDAELQQLKANYRTGEIDKATRQKGEIAWVARHISTGRTVRALEQRSALLNRAGGAQGAARSPSPARRRRAGGGGAEVALRFGHRYKLSSAQVEFRARGYQFLKVGYLGYAVLILLAVLALGDPGGPGLDRTTPDKQQQLHAVLTVAAMLLTFFWQHESLLVDPPPEPTDDSWSFLSKCPVHKFIFLTVNIDAVQLLYWVSSTLVATGSLIGISPALHWRLTSVVYGASTFVSTLGFSLALLFLKFNYFEPKFQANVLAPRIKRGIPARYYALIGHLCALPLNLCDLLFIKDRSLLGRYVLPLWVNVAIGFGYGFLYLAWMKYNHKLSGLWPYPFCEELFVSVEAQFAFATAIGVATSALSLLLRCLSLNSDGGLPTHGFGSCMAALVKG